MLFKKNSRVVVTIEFEGGMTGTRILGIVVGEFRQWNSLAQSSCFQLTNALRYVPLCYFVSWSGHLFGSRKP